MAIRPDFPERSGITLLIPPGDVRGWGVFSHGFTLGKDCPAASRICKQLAADGIGMLRFDNLGRPHRYHRGTRPHQRRCDSKAPAAKTPGANSFAPTVKAPPAMTALPGNVNTGPGN